MSAPAASRAATPTVLCRGLLFDLDGVLVNSTPAVERVWRAWAVEHGFDPGEVAGRALGRPSLETLRHYLPHANHQLENEVFVRREAADLDGVEAMPGAAALLQALPPEAWAVVTSCTRPLAEARWGAAGLPRPRHWVTSDMIAHGKPAPDGYLRGAEVLGLTPADCVVLEDAPVGIAAGKAAGARVLAVTTTTPAAALWAAGADWLAPSVAALRLEHTTPTLTFTLESALPPPPKSQKLTANS